MNQDPADFRQPQQKEWLRIDYRDLSAQALEGLVESYVLQEGTDYGHSEHPLAAKVAAVKSQIQSGTALIAFNPSEQICLVMTKREFDRKS
jgi:uncharacterized protein YheU (UPF0270 family)